MPSKDDIDGHRYVDHSTEDYTPQSPLSRQLVGLSLEVVQQIN